MDDLNLFELFGEIDPEIVQQANDNLNSWQRSREGVVVRAGSSSKFPARIAIASVACAAAVVLGVFFLMRNVWKNGFLFEPTKSGSPVQSEDSRSASSAESSNSAQGWGASSIDKSSPPLESDATSANSYADGEEVAVNSEALWGIGRTFNEVEARYGAITSVAIDTFTFENGYGTYTWGVLGGTEHSSSNKDDIISKARESGDYCTAIKELSARDMLTGDISTVTLDNFEEKTGFKLRPEYPDDPEATSGGYAWKYYSHPDYEEMDFVLMYKLDGFDEDAYFSVFLNHLGILGF